MIPVYKPWLTELEKKYVAQAIDSSWISSSGYFIDKAEELFADFIGVKYCVLTTSGTTALHLCFRALDESYWQSGAHRGAVIIPNTTFIASAFAAEYDRRNIVLVDVDPKTWNLDINALENVLKTQVVNTVMVVHLYGNPADMEKISELQKIYGFKVIEDACEALGATVKGQKTGSLSDVACFSFYGNKTFTCGEGGAVVTDDPEIIEKTRLLRGQAQDPNKRYWHIDVGYNYRLTNTQAAILTGQLERADEILAEKQRVSDRYHRNLESVLSFQTVLPGHTHSDWLVTATVDGNREKLSQYLKEKGIDSRKVFYPISDMKPFARDQEYPVSSWLSEHGISLPSYPTLTNPKIDYICDAIKSGLANER
jgi:perosamine synthetase